MKATHMKRCCICENVIMRYAPIDSKYLSTYDLNEGNEKVEGEAFNPDEYMCPLCYAIDRDRLIVLFLKKLRSYYICEPYGLNILHMAPSVAISNCFYQQWPLADYCTLDLYMDDVDYRADIQEMNEIESGSVDILICSHVLEHVKDDRLAMRELHRVLNSQGIGLILVPLDLNRKVTDEAWGLSAKENLRRFGQEDHVRSYAKQDFIKRLENAGFIVLQLNMDFFGEMAFRENAITETSVLYLVTKACKTPEDAIKAFQVLSGRIQMKQIVESFAFSSRKCKYWIDQLEDNNGFLSILGWIYLTNSIIDRLYLELRKDEDIEVFRLHLWKREDVVNAFSDAKYGLYSGINSRIPLRIMHTGEGVYNISFLLMRKGVSWFKQNIRSR